jgi:hypothetical protein
MEASLREFKEKFYNALLDIHWKQWAALGVTSHVKAEGKWIIDLEPLTVSTLTIGLHDKRLLSSSTEWLVKKREWINLSRLKRIVKVFLERSPGLEEPALLPEILGLFIDTYNKNARNKIKFGKCDSDGLRKNLINEYKTFFNAFKIRNIITEPRLHHSSLIQLLLRSILGVDAHTEILIYLLANESGNSNSIAKEIYYNQKNIYTILERWSRAQMVTKISEQKIPRYSLNRKKELLYAFGLKEIPKYINWTRTFLLLDRLSKALSTPPWSDDEYLLSSLFRDLFNESKSIGKSLGINMPEPAHYPGKQYFSPFALGVLSILKKLAKGD